jgi:hypothetical protein
MRKVTCGTCSATLSEEFPVCDDHPTARILVEGCGGASICLTCSKHFIRRNPLDKSERRCAPCATDKECDGNAHHLGIKDKRTISKKFKQLFPKVKGIASRFIEGEDDG